MSGFLGDLSPQQQATLDIFRKTLALKGILRARDDDVTLLRFLRARQFDLEKAEAMFAAMLKFREENNVDTIREVRSTLTLSKPWFHSVFPCPMLLHLQMQPALDCSS